MKTLTKLVAILALALSTVGTAQATTWYVGGVLMGNVCRNGAYYFIYPISYGQPVGSSCPVRDGAGNVIGSGFVSNE